MNTKRLLQFPIAVMLFLFNATPHSVYAETPQVLYVRQGGQTGGSCESWINACELQYALTSATYGQELWVAVGVYKPTSGTDRTASFQLKSGVRLYAGFNGMETSRDQRDWKTNLTILSGDIDNNDINTDGDFIAETIADIQGQNTHHLIIGSDTDNAAVMDGFIITAGQADDDLSGGGLYNQGGNLALTNIIFSANFASPYGGGMYNMGGSPNLSNITFSGNSASSFGGGLFTANSSPTLTDVTFSTNSGTYGGGLFNVFGSPTLTSVVFSANLADFGGGMSNNLGRPILMNSIFSANSANYRGGAMYSSGGGMYNLSQPILVNSILWGDNAPDGPEIYSTDSYSNPGITYSDVQGGWPGTGNLSTDPFFVDAANGNLHLQAGSPAIDNGTNPGCSTVDFDGVPRPQDGNNDGIATCDMGAFEFALHIIGNTGVAVVALSYTDGTPRTVMSDNSGNYTITVPYFWSGTVTPAKSCYTFSPVHREFTNVAINQTSQDFIATNVTTYTISGNAGSGGVTLSYTDGTPQTVTSDSSGSYSVTVPCDWAGTITPSKVGHLFVPAFRAYSNLTADQPAQNYNLYSLYRVSLADFNGDGKTDVAVFRPSNSTWYIQGVGSFVYGQAGDIPVPADYNGDGKDEIAVFRPSNSTWYIQGVGSFVYGTVGDIPVVADYNGDGKDDIAVFRPSNSTWYIYGVGPRVYGTVGDIPVVADYNGDGKDDIAVFRPTNNTWYIYGIGPRVYGTVGDIPVIADYNGDGKADIAVFRPTNSTWYLYGIGPSVYGMVGDIPVVGDYNGDGKADIAVFRPSNSTWYIYGVGPSVYGTVGDIPV